MFKFFYLGLFSSCLISPSFGLLGEDVSTPAGFSLGDRLVLEITYNTLYQSLPLTVDDAVAQSWQMDPFCTDGRGRRAVSQNFKNASGSVVWRGGSALDLWFDQAGVVVGFGVEADGHSSVAAPWYQNRTGGRIDFLLRDPASACGNSTAVANSIGNRFVMVKQGKGYERIPLTLHGAQDAKYNDGGPCFPHMGWHMMHDRFEVSSPAPVYDGPGNNGGKLLGLNLNTYHKELTPSYEAGAPKEGNTVYGWHVYFRDHRDACKNSEAAPVLPFGGKDSKHSHKVLKCTPYFGNMWVMAPLSVVDLHASGASCRDADGQSSCTFVNFLGPTEQDGTGTPCMHPSPTDGCHCYIQTMYDETCGKRVVSTSTLSGKVDMDGIFDSNGTLRACVGQTVHRSVVGWAPSKVSPDGLTSCNCDERGQPVEASSLVVV